MSKHPYDSFCSCILCMAKRQLEIDRGKRRWRAALAALDARGAKSMAFNVRILVK